jgi:hypothetical protein
MAWSAHESGAFEDRAVGVNLVWQPIQRVPLALDLIAVGHTIERGNISAVRTTENGELL